MIENVEGTQRQADNFKTTGGIGLYKIRYEMDVVNTSRDQNYIAGVIAYSSDEAVQTLVDFAKARVKGFKGLKIDEVAFEGGCHAMSDTVRNEILKVAIMEGKVIAKTEYEDTMVELEKAKKKAIATKKSIVPKKD